MPSYSHLSIPRTRCPRCGRQYRNRDVDFYYGKSNCWYRCGDAVKWLRDITGAIAPPLTLVDYRRSLFDRIVAFFDPRWPWNYGEPGFSSVLVLDYHLATEPTFR